MDDFTFTDRETYIEWRITWKQEYKEISNTIQYTRIEIKNQHRSQGYASFETWRKLRAYTRKANAALQTLKLAKQAAQQQYTRFKAEAIAC